MEFLNDIKKAAETAVSELIEAADLKSGDVFIIGCSTSEITGDKIGTSGSDEAAKAIFETISPLLKEKGVFLAAQCCEHLNRAVVLERAAAVKYDLDIVCVRPRKTAGGAFAAACYENLSDSVMVENVKAKAVAGIDIGGTLIGMHIKPVAVPVRLSVTKIGGANIICAKSRPKYIGGERAVYN